MGRTLHRFAVPLPFAGEAFGSPAKGSWRRRRLRVLFQKGWWLADGFKFKAIFLQTIAVKWDLRMMAKTFVRGPIFYPLTTTSNTMKSTAILFFMVNQKVTPSFSLRTP